MFKKRKHKAVAARRQKTTESDDSDDEDLNVGAKIQQTKKKRQLLENLQFAKGTAATDLMAPPAQKNTPKVENEEKEGSKESILDKKHRLAMEAFVNENMPKEGHRESKEDESSLMKSKTSTPKDELYQELAAKAAELAGKSQQRDNAEASGVLVAGTGIAEVVLPPKQRLQTATVTTTSDNGSNSMTEKRPRNKEGRVQAVSREAQVDKDRIGFAATRQRQAPQKTQKPTLDDRVYQKFVAQEKRKR